MFSVICPSRAAECARVCVCVRNIFPYILLIGWRADSNSSLKLYKTDWWSLKKAALEGYLAFFRAIESTGVRVIRHGAWNNRQQKRCLQAKLICFHLRWKLPQAQCKSRVCLPVTLPMSLSLCRWRYLYSYMCFTVLCVFSGGRNIVVTGSGFDLIQTAVMEVRRDNMTAFEVRVYSICFTVPYDFQPSVQLSKSSFLCS